MDKILIIDAHNAMWRACSLFGPPVPHYRKPTEDNCNCNALWDTTNNACYGDQYVFVNNFFRNLRPLIELFAPEKCFFVLEGHPQFRYDLFADYKANRIVKTAVKQETNDKFFKIKDIIIPLMQHLPITMCRASSYEADDVVATLCENMKQEDLTVLSSDSDYIQLLQRGYPKVQVYNPIKKVFMEAPSYPYVAWKCLNGDKSDNIPSLLKPKKALATINDPEVFKKFMEVEENRANFNVNRQLIEFRAVPEEEISTVDGIRNFPVLKDSFIKMKFQQMTEDKSWDKYCKTFDCIKY